MNRYEARFAGVFSAATLLVAACRGPAIEPSMSVYVTDEFARVRPRDASGLRRVALLSAARNEYAPFQIVVRAGTSGLKGVNALAGPLSPERGRAIPADRITLFREHYIEVRKSSPKARGAPGWYPDALIPFLDPSTGKPPAHARFTAAPFDVAPDSNQPIWVDVQVPRDATPGVYLGTITVSAVGLAPHTVRIQLSVWDFTLPDTPSMRTHFGGTDVNPLLSGAPPTDDGSGLDEAGKRVRDTAYAQLMATHRICAPIPQSLRPKVNADGSIAPPATQEALQQWIERFHITGFPIWFLGNDTPEKQIDPLGSDRERNGRYLRSMYSYLRSHHWDRMAYIYVLDEPNSREAYRDVRARSKFVRDVAPGLKVLCTRGPQAGNPLWGSLVGWVDIWAPLWPTFEEAAVRRRLAAGEEVWSYTALCQGRETPYWQLDFPVLNYRIPTWINWRLGITGLLYWNTTNWASAKDVWTNPLTYQNQYNMEGSLVYPGAEAGVQGFIGSIRLKEIREGLEDYEYLRILERRRSRAAAEAVVKKIARTWHDWDTNPRHLLDARAEIARMILAK